MSFIFDVFTADQDRRAQTRASDRASQASETATRDSLALQERMFNTLWGGTQVQRDAGDAATRMMAQLMGLNLPSTPQSPTGQPQTQPALSTSSGATGGVSGGYSGNDNALMGYGMQDMALQAGDASGIVRPNALAGLQGGPQVMPQEPGAPQVLPGQTGAGGAAGTAFNATDWLRSTPGYQFNFDEGARALNTRLAGQGRLQSGDASREAIRYGQNYGDRIYSDQYNRLAGIAGAGQTAQSQGQAAGQNYANNGSNALQWNAGNQMQSSYNRGNAQSGFWGDVNAAGNNLANTAARFMGGF